MNKRVNIIYISISGITEMMVQAAAEGAREAGAEVKLIKATESTGEDVENCDALIWGTGNYYGYMHGLLKAWFDREHGPLARKAKAEKTGYKPYFCCLSAAGNPYRQLPVIERLSRSMNLKKAFEPATAVKTLTPEALALCRELGYKLVSVDTENTDDLYVPPPLPGKE
jgi:multimeric flavodoxin WrbA